MKREVRPEILDELPPDDRRAIGARRDLQKLNVLMGHTGTMIHALSGTFTIRSPLSIVELGAGDGTLLLKLAKKMPAWKPQRVVLVDRQRLVSPQTMAEFQALSWHIEPVEMDVFDWLQRAHPEQSDVTITSLFLHHFKVDDLRRLLWHASRQTGFFLACEPRRVTLARCAAALVGFIGCNSVTRHDARISVGAGFAESELSALWPVDEAWRLTERRAGLFSHSFVARRKSEFCG